MILNIFNGKRFVRIFDGCEGLSPSNFYLSMAWGRENEFMSHLIVNNIPLVAVRRLSVSVFAAVALLLCACGGGSGTVGENSRLDGKSPVAETPSNGGNGSIDNGDADDGAGDGSDGVPNGSGDGIPDPDTDGPDGGGEPVVDGGDVIEPDVGDDDPTTDHGADPVEDVISEVSGAVRLEWVRPDSRENGEFLEGDEIGGYELRYRRVGKEEFETVIVNDGWDDDYEFGELVGSYQFSIAAFDNNGLYSEFVSLSPVSGLLNAN